MAKAENGCAEAYRLSVEGFWIGLQADDDREKATKPLTELKILVSLVRFLPRTIPALATNLHED